MFLIFCKSFKESWTAKYWWHTFADSSINLIGMYGCEATKFWSFWHQPISSNSFHSQAKEFRRFPKRVSTRGPSKRAQMAFSLKEHINHMGKGSTWCTRIIQRIYICIFAGLSMLLKIFAGLSMLLPQFPYHLNQSIPCLLFRHF